MTHRPPPGPLADVAPPRGLIAGTRYSMHAIYARRHLLGLLTRRELTSRYKDSSLGFLWSLMRPLALLLIYYIAVGKFLGAERHIPDFAIFIFSGLTAWTLFSEVVSSATRSIVSNAGLVKKIYIPRELFPLASVGSAIFNFAVQLGILLVVTAILGQFRLSIDLLFLPAGLVVLLVFALAVGLILAAWNVYLRDVEHLVEVALLVLFWASPIVYSYDMVHAQLGGNWLESLYLANPITTIVIAFQRGLWSSGATDPSISWPPHLWLNLLALGITSLLALWVAQRAFARLEGNFAQEL